MLLSAVGNTGHRLKLPTTKFAQSIGVIIARLGEAKKRLTERYFGAIIYLTINKARAKWK